ncbi:MAG: D-alanyl-D-alanine carboxypeptidase/D-alanyl-D-alanine endopeptidase [Gammaproteobacteria bacterium]
MKRLLAFLLLASVMQAPVHAATPLAPLQALAAHGARVSALIVRLNDHKTLAAIQPDLALTPASTSKLYVAASALQQWGPDYRFTTRLLGTGPVENGVLKGDLIFAGAGDPALTTAQLFVLTRRLAERGIHRVTGHLIVDASYFGHIACTAHDRCHALDDSHNAYNALLSSAAIDFATAQISVIPAAVPGTSATVHLAPFDLPGVRIVNRVRTGPATSGWSIRVDRHTAHDRDTLTVSGTTPAGAMPHRFWRALSDPDRAAGAQLLALLAAAGIQVDGGARVTYKSAPTGHVLAAIKGQALALQLSRMLIWSNNFMADTLALDLLRTTQSPPLTLTAAGELLTKRGRALEVESGLWGKHTPGLELASGSGLTISNRASAHDMVALLATMYQKPGLFPSFLGALTVPAYTPVNLLKASQQPAWMHAIAAKTGSLNNPHSVFALAGYARLADGHWGAFAVVINGSKKYDVPLGMAIDATRKALTPYLQNSH